MNKQTGSILLVAGTCIGSGMIALPMVLAKLGLIPSVLLMFLIWGVMYYTSLINVELNLKVGRGLTLGKLGRLFSGPIAEIIGTGSLKLLSYALLAVFIYGGSSVLQKLLHEAAFEFTPLATGYAVVTFLVLLLPIKLLDYMNRILFLGLLGVVALLMAGLLSMISWQHLPLLTEGYKDPKAWAIVLPVVFTSFGFQVIFHTLTNYCHNDARILKRAFFWGSLIPAVVYILWTCGILSVVYYESPTFYSEMMAGQREVGDLIQELSRIAEWKTLQLLVWWISLLAVFTSVLGVGVGLCDSLKGSLAPYVRCPSTRQGLAAFLTVLPAYAVAIWVPNAFISVLGFAGLTLAIIAILLPIYLFYKAKITRLHYPELRYKWLIIISLCVGVAVIVAELSLVIVPH